MPFFAETRTPAGAVAAPELGQGQVRRQQWVQPGAQVGVQIPELAPDLLVYFVAEETIAGDFLYQPHHLAGQFDLARLAQRVDPFLHHLLHDILVVQHLLAPERLQHHRALVQIYIVRCQEKHLTEHGAQEGVRLLNAQRLVGLHEEDPLILRSDQDGNVLVRQLDGKDRTVLLETAPDKAGAVTAKFQGMPQTRQSAGNERWCWLVHCLHDPRYSCSFNADIMICSIEVMIHRVS